MARKTFADHEAEQDAGAPAAPARRTFACRAHGCELAGAIDGLCNYHWSANPDDWKAVTGLMFQHRALVREINRARALFADIGSDPSLVLGGHAAAMERLRGHLSAEQITYLREHPVANYHGFLSRIEQLLSHAVLRGVSKKRAEQRQLQPVSTRTPAEIFNEMYP